MHNLLDYNRTELQIFFEQLAEKPYRASQVLQWIHQYGVVDFSAMTNLSKVCRQQLQETATVALPEVALDRVSKDGTRKWLLRLHDNNCIETVFIPEAGRGTLCVSSQVGCALNCRFCSTGAMGFNRNLSCGEIIGQVWFAVRQLAQTQQQVTNVVMMGMGEPLLNYDNVIKAMDIMMDDHAYGLSKHRVTLSTSGLVPNMQKLSRDSACSLAVSLHAANNELRTRIVPINKKYPLEQLIATCKTFFADEPRRKVTFEYTMLKDVNDSIVCAKQLVNLLEGVPAKVNLIPFNPFPGTQYECSAVETIIAFRDVLKHSGMNVMIRKTRGDDIDAACGQLVGDFKDRTRRSQRNIEAIT